MIAKKMLVNIACIILANQLSAQSASIKPETSSTEQTAQEVKKPTLVISGYADVYYKYDLGRNAGNNKTSFTNTHNSFELGMASIRLDHTSGNVSMTADMGIGKRAEEFSYNDKNTNFIIKQLFLSYAVSDKLKLTMGSWATHVGYELVDPYANRNYSMSYMFSYGPFFHTGFKAEYTLGKSTLMLGLADPTDFKSAIANSKKFLIGQYSYVSGNSKMKAYINYQSGKRPADNSKLMQVDAVLNYQLNNKWSLGYNGTSTYISAYDASKNTWSAADKWWGSALYLNFDPSATTGITLRSEYFSDQKGLAVMSSLTPNGGHIFANTLSANFKLNNITIIPELRLENSSQAIYQLNSVSKKSSASLLLAAVYRF
ncbi:MAG TPA: porin [Chitinophagaceae bacterium]|nr:porin [Chitinophagaceae bacterium]HCT24008.1 porin [Chitinophagaceae bacterium]